MKEHRRLLEEATSREREARQQHDQMQLKLSEATDKLAGVKAETAEIETETASFKKVDSEVEEKLRAALTDMEEALQEVTDKYDALSARIAARAGTKLATDVALAREHKRERQ